MKEMGVRSLGWEDPLEPELSTHSSILAWKISWTKEPPWGHKESDMTKHKHTHMHTIVLQCCVSYCWTMKQINYMYAYIPSLLGLSPTIPPSHPSRSPQEGGVAFEHRMDCVKGFALACSANGSIQMCVWMIFYFYLVCFTLSISYSGLPFHLVYIFQFLRLFLFDVLSQAFIRCSRKAFVYTYINSM